MPLTLRYPLTLHFRLQPGSWLTVTPGLRTVKFRDWLCCDGAMSELRYRPPEAVPAPDRPPHPDSPRQSDRQATEQPALDTRHARDDIARYDADAQFKHSIAKPDGYLPHDADGTAPTPTASRERVDWSIRRDDPDLTWHKDPADAPALEEVTEADRADVLRVVVDRPDCHNPDGTRAPDGSG